MTRSLIGGSSDRDQHGCSGEIRERLEDTDADGLREMVRVLAEDRADLELSEFAIRMAKARRCSTAEMSSSSRSRELTHRRIDFCTLAIGRYRLSVCDDSNLLQKYRNSITN